MIETIRHLITEGEEAVIVSNWALFMVTSLEAKVGLRIYNRMTILINILSGKIAKKAVEPQPTPKPRPAKALNDGHYFQS